MSEFYGIGPDFGDFEKSVLLDPYEPQFVHL